jgi:hypothetical protein
MAQQSERPAVQLPDPSADRPVWARVGVIATVGFALGIVWPRLAGVRLGPSPPEDGRAAMAASASAAAVSSAAASAQAAAGSASAPARPAPILGTVVVKPGKVTSCRTKKGKTPEDCGATTFDQLALPRFRGLSGCGAAIGQSGKLSVGFDIDFTHNRLRLIRGKSTTLPEVVAKGIWQCVESEFQKVTLDEVTHDHARYTIFYALGFYSAGKGPAAEADAASEKPDKGEGEDKKTKEPKEPATGTAQVVYDTVLVREEPKDGKVVGRLVRGTRVELLSQRGGWCRIRFGDREGWVYRGSIAQ